MAKIIAAFLFTLGCLGIALSGQAELRKQIVSIQLDRDEIKLHTDQLARIVVTQQYQIDILTELLTKE